MHLYMYVMSVMLSCIAIHTKGHVMHGKIEAGSKFLHTALIDRRLVVDIIKHPYNIIASM